MSWDSATGELVEIHPRGVSNFDIYGKKIIACCQDGNLRVWVREKPKLTGPDVIHIADRSLGLVTLSHTGLVAVSQGKSVHILRITSQGILRMQVLDINHKVCALSFSALGTYLVIAISSKITLLFLCSKNSNWEQVGQNNPTTGRLCHITWLREKPIVCIGWSDGTASLWNLETQSIISGPLYHSRGVCQVAISPDGKTLATGTKEGYIKIWDVEMLLEQGESGTGNHFQIPKAENPKLAGVDNYDKGWIVGQGGEQLLWCPKGGIGLLFNSALKHTTMSMQLDLSNFVHGKDWAKCYSGDAGGEQEE